MIALGILARPVSSQVSAPFCSNGVIEPGESCDDGNLLNGDGCSAACRIEQQCYDEGNTFSFFVWSDSYTSAGDSGVQRVFADAVNAARYAGRVIPRFWISTGDVPFMVDGNDRLDRLNDIISNSSDGARYPFACPASNGRFPSFVAIGNHDIDGYTSSTPAVQYQYWSQYIGPRLGSELVGIKNFHAGPDNGHDALTSYSFDYKNAHFVITNQYFDDPNYPTSNPLACVRPTLYDWIDRDLAATEQPVKMIFGHAGAWSYCSSEPGYGGAEFCPQGHPDNLTPAYRPRPWSAEGPWEEPFGRHWGDSLENPLCPTGSRDAFWRMLARHNVVAHVMGHNHTYSSRLVRGDGGRRNDVSPYGKTGQGFGSPDGVWEVSTGQTHNSSGAVYLLVTVRDKVVNFEAYDQHGMVEPFTLVENWSVAIDDLPTVSLTSPAPGTSSYPLTPISLNATAADADGTVTRVAFYANDAEVGSSLIAPYSATWRPSVAGTYQVTAVATDDRGGTATSAPVSVTINAPVSHLTNPPNGATGVDIRSTITWTSVDNADAYYLYAGTAPGGKDLINTGETAQTSYPASSLPGGRTVYARLWTKWGGTWRSSDSSFTTAATTAVVTTPANGSTGADPSQPIQWTNVANADAYYLWGGSTPGAKDLIDTGELHTTSFLAPALPSARIVYTRLWTRWGGVWRSSDGSFMTALFTSTVTSPSSGAANVDPTQPIQWLVVPNAQAYYLWGGTTPGGKDLIDTGEVHQTSLIASALPSARVVYTRLWTKWNGVWRSSDASFTTILSAAAVSTPANGAVGVDPMQAIRWNAIAGAQAYSVWCGSTPGARDFVDSGELTGTSFTTSKLPTGRTVYARLWTKWGNVWRSTDASFSTSTLRATLTTPPNGASNVDRSQPMQWTSVAGAQAYYLFVGTTAGAKNIVDTGEIVQTTWSPTLLPAGTMLYARLWTKFGGVWRFIDSTFTTAR